MHIRKVIRQFQPALKSLLVRCDSRADFVAVSVFGNTLRIFIVNGSAVTEIGRASGNSHIVVCGHCCRLGCKLHPIRMCVIIIENRLYHSSGELLKLTIFLRSGESCFETRSGDGKIAVILYISLYDARTLS